MEPDEALTIAHPELGDLTFDPIVGWWSASVGHPAIRDKHVPVATVDDSASDVEHQCQLLLGFLAWLTLNYEAFIRMASAEAINHDLVWDMNSTALAAILKIDSVDVFLGEVRVWFDTGGATTDHQIKTTLNADFGVVDMELF